MKNNNLRLCNITTNDSDLALRRALDKERELCFVYGTLTATAY